MTFSATDRLWLLAVLVGVVAAYVVRQRRRARDAAAFTSTAMLASVAPRRPGRRRHLAAVGVVVGSALAVIAFAGPAHAVRSARPGATVVLALDISPSMAANDVVPTRIRAAQSAAIRFTKTLPQRFRLGLVTFGGIAHVDALPTSNHRAVLEELSHLELEPRTAIGEAIFASLDAIRSANANAVIESGRRPSARIVLLSDGDTNAGRSNEDATAAALRSRVPVSTIAFGTNGSGVDIFGESVYVAPNPPPRSRTRISTPVRSRISAARSSRTSASARNVAASRSCEPTWAWRPRNSMPGSDAASLAASRARPPWTGVPNLDSAPPVST